MGSNPTVTRFCAGCGNHFESRNRGSNRGWTRYCSNTCRGKFQGFKGGPEASRRRRRYGLEPHEHEAMLAKQGGKCALCKTKPEYGLYVDHNHATKQVRGLLCARCNNTVGVFDQLGSMEVFTYWSYACQDDWETGNTPLGRTL